MGTLLCTAPSLCVGSQAESANRILRFLQCYWTTGLRSLQFWLALRRYYKLLHFKIRFLLFFLRFIVDSLFQFIFIFCNVMGRGEISPLYWNYEMLIVVEVCIMQCNILMHS